MKKYVLCLFATGICAIVCADSQSQDSIAPSSSTGHAKTSIASAKGPYELTFEDFDWQTGDSKPLPNSATGLGERMPTEKAIDLFRKRVERGASDYASRTVLGELYLRQATEEDCLPAYSLAMGVLQDALRIKPDYKPAILWSAKVMMAQHQFADALKLIGEGIPADSQSPADLAIIVDCHLDMGNVDQAKVVLEQLAKLEKSPPIDARLARLAELTGNREKAIQIVRSSLDTVKAGSADETEWHWYQWRLAGLVFDSGDLDESELLVQKILDDSANDERASILLARIAFAKNQVSRAQGLLEQVVKLHPSPPVLAMLGDLFQHQGEKVKATECWGKAEELIREEAAIAKAAHAREAAIFFADHDRHVNEAMDLILLDRNQRKDFNTADAFAWILFKNQQWNEAAAEIKALMQKQSNDLLSLYHATKIHQALGNIDAAKGHLQKVVDVNPRFSIQHAADIARLQSEWKLSRSR